MNIDEQGNKIAEKKISDKTKGKKERMLAAETSKRLNEIGIRDDHCPQCGYRVRARGHFKGVHHNS